MFKFELGDVGFYMRHNKIHSAPILSRMLIENQNDKPANETQKDLYQPFGKGIVMYSTTHGQYDEKAVFGSKEELIQSLIAGDKALELTNKET